eukprot:TRINITY_DN26135_c0_g1_i1.p1 TRINITY_DN26135_c0_g1~~TRINITY_DN26135_c0_g1_i1.p1  ORF type:complete len:441 (-),score=135.13 TRINITY_DN26135_c0_g1_i1:86-1408(-)
MLRSLVGSEMCIRDRSEMLQVVAKGRASAMEMRKQGKETEAAELEQKLSQIEEAANKMIGPAAEESDDDDGLFGWFSQMQLENIDTEEFDECPLFMDEEDLKDPKNAGVVEWLANCQYGDMDALEIALDLKERGNKALKGEAMQDGGASTKPNPKMAITIYDDALCQNCGDKMLESVLWSNRAAAHMKLKNWGHVMHDCVKAIRLNKTGIKPYWRGAQASLKIKKFKEAAEFCKEGLKLEEDNKELLGLQKKAVESAAAAEKEAARIAAKESMEKQVEKTRLAIIAERGVRIGVRPEWLDNSYHLDLRGANMAYVDDENYLHWAVAFLYPEHAQSDLVQDVHEECSLGEQLEMMFPPACPPLSWDTEHKYVLPQLLVCYERGVDVDGKKPKERFKEVPLDVSLKSILALPDLVVPGYPAFHVVSRDSAFAKQYLDDTYIY